MNEELQKEIEEAQSLGRAERHKKERQLRKKYGDKTIKIGSGKTFKQSEGLNRSARRKLVKDKDLVAEVLKIIKKYFPMLDIIIDNLTDKRNKSYITYGIRAIIYTRLFAFICGITTATGVSSTVIFDKEFTIKNLAKICNQKIEEIPHWQTIQDVIEQLDIEEIRDIRRYMVKALIRSKMFYKYRHKKYFQLVVDGTGVSSHDYNLNGNCTFKTFKNCIKFYKSVLEAKIIVGKIALSLDTEWIENSQINNEKEKQDCEINAFKRMAPRIKKEYPQMKFLITGDALYGTDPTIQICDKYKWKYIFNLKKDRLKNVYNDFEDDLAYENETSKEHYFLSTKIKYKEHSLKAIRYEETQNNKLIVFNYITNLKVNDHNIEEIVKLGRSRWKIENEGFNEQKNGTFCISHLCSRNENAIRIYYYFIQIAHIIRQLLEYGSSLLKEMKVGTKKEVSTLILNSLTSSTSDLNNLEINFQLRFDD